MPLKHLSLAKFPPIDMFTFSPWCLSVAVQDMNCFLPLCCFIQVQMSELLNKLRYRNIYLQEKATTHSGRQIQKRQRGCRSFHNFAPFSRCEIKGHLAKKPDSQEKIYWGNIIWTYTTNSNKITSSEELFSFSLKPASCSFCLWN